MAQRILVLESDEKFATELRAGFLSLGAEVEVVSDGTTGLERVQALKPDLILLSIELAGMNGFLVCNKIRKKADLKGIPLVVMSSSPTASDSFEKHRELQTRADEYLRKPIAFDDLIDKVQRFVKLDGSAAGGLAAPKSGAPKSSAAGDDEIDAFADSAFDALMGGASMPSPAAKAASADTDSVELPPEESTGVSAPPVHIAEDEVEEFIELDDDAGLELEDIAVARTSTPAPAKAASERPPAPVRAPSEKPAAAAAVDTALVDELQRKLAAAESRAEEAERIAQDLKAAKSVRPQPAVSSRDLLDLNERLNTKDKELLDLKDQLNTRDKEVVELRSKSLQFERAKADLDDKVFAAERENEDLKTKVTALESDRDMAQKRAGDMKDRAERAEARIKQLEVDADAIRADGEAKLSALEEKQAAHAARNASAHASEMDKLRAELGAALEAEKKGRGDEVSALRSEHEQATSKLAAQHSSELQRLQDEHSSELARRVAQATAEAESRIAETTAKLAAQAERDAEKARSDHDQALAALRTELETAAAASLKQADDKHGKELVLIGRKLTETESRYEELQVKFTQVESALEEAKTDTRKANEALDSVRAELSAAKATADDIGKRLRRAEQKISDDSALLERARKAFSIGLSLLEDQKNEAAE
jgi:DNA-binding response OmpR family regulator/chromosome segregation ATPase